MGTRHLIAVMIASEYRIAQYGQWDGYPDGQGGEALTFLRDKERVAALRDNATKTRWLTDEEVTATWKEMGANDSGLVSMDIAAKHTEKYPQLSRDTGAKILDIVASRPPGIGLHSSIDFAADSLFCEWAYVIDFDKGTFEVYKGFNKDPLPKGERFAKAKTSERAASREDRYYPVRLLATFQLDALPTDGEFLKACRTEEDEEDDGDEAQA